MLRQNSYTSGPHFGARFVLGQTFITPGAEEALQIAGQTAIEFLRRHISGDSGELQKTIFARTSCPFAKAFDYLATIEQQRAKSFGSSLRQIGVKHHPTALRLLVTVGPAAAIASGPSDKST